MLTVTDRATAAIKSVCTDEFLGLRIMASSGGCSGVTYRMGLETEIEADDAVVELDGIKLLIDPSSVMWLTGVTMDYVDSSGGSGFVFENPNAAKSCSCGSKSC